MFFAFDLLHLDGEDLRRKGLSDRRARLQELMGDAAPTIRFSESYRGDAQAFFRAAVEHGLEGIVSKRIGSRYLAGPTNRWLKTKCFEESALILLGTEVKEVRPASRTPRSA